MTLPLPARILVLSGGVGGARFLQGLLRAVHDDPVTVTVVANTADDIWLHGLKICPDLDTVMYTLGGGIDEERGWGRTGETWHAKEELAAYGVQHPLEEAGAAHPSGEHGDPCGRGRSGGAGKCHGQAL